MSYFNIPPRFYKLLQKRFDEITLPDKVLMAFAKSLVQPGTQNTLIDNAAGALREKFEGFGKVKTKEHVFKIIRLSSGQDEILIVPADETPTIFTRLPKRKIAVYDGESGDAEPLSAVHAKQSGWRNYRQEIGPVFFGYLTEKEAAYLSAFAGIEVLTPLSGFAANHAMGMSFVFLYGIFAQLSNIEGMPMLTPAALLLGVPFIYAFVYQVCHRFIARATRASLHITAWDTDTLLKQGFILGLDLLGAVTVIGTEFLVKEDEAQISALLTGALGAGGVAFVQLMLSLCKNHRLQTMTGHEIVRQVSSAVKNALTFASVIMIQRAIADAIEGNNLRLLPVGPPSNETAVNFGYADAAGAAGVVLGISGAELLIATVINFICMSLIVLMCSCWR